MLRNINLQDTARFVCTSFKSQGGELSYAQALDFIAKFEGFEGYRQLRALLRPSMQKAKAQITLSVPEPEATQTLAMLLHGHGGYKDGQRVYLPSPRIEGIRPTKMTDIGASRISPSVHRLWVEDLEALQIAADWDAGERYFAALHDDTVILNYAGVTGVYSITWKELKSAKFVGNGVWDVDGTEYEFLTYVPAPSPEPVALYAAKPGEFMTQAEYLAHQSTLDHLEMAHAMGQDQPGHYDEVQAICLLMETSP